MTVNAITQSCKVPFNANERAMALIFGYKVLKLLLSAVNGKAPRKPLVRWVQMT